MRSTVAIFAALIVLATALVGMRFLGYGVYVVTSGSMEPAIPMGSLIVAQAVRPEDVQPGDVITYALPDRVVTHRVESISVQDGRVVFVTRGDANVVVDPWLVEPDGAVGDVHAALPVLGFAVAGAQAWWRPLALALLAWLLFDTVATRARRAFARGALAHGTGA